MNQSSDSSNFLNRISIVTATDRFTLGGPPGAAHAGKPAFAHTISLGGEAMRWSYVLRSRERWRDNTEVNERHQREAAEVLRLFGLDDAALRRIAAAGRAVVEMPYESEKSGWDGRIFPWEYVLSRATHRYRTGGVRLTVMRHLDVSRPVPQTFRPEPKVLFVQSLPGALAQAFDVQEEAERVRDAFGFEEGDPRWCSLVTPTLHQLHQTCESFRPDVVHLSGCDNHQGLGLLRGAAGGETRVALGDRVRSIDEWLHGDPDDGGVIDGYLMRRSEDGLAMCSPQELGRALTAGGAHTPFFVGLNFWNSGARVAPLLLAEGVLSCLGFHDVFDDALAEYLYETLYRELCQERWHLPNAFDTTWGITRRQIDLVPGTGVALWARAPLIETWVQAAPASSAVRLPSSSRLPPPPGVRQPVTGPARVAVTAVIEPKKEINYAELHNHGTLFKRFELRGAVTTPRTRVHVVVELHCGTERARYESEVELNDERLGLSGRIRVPLTAVLMRSVSEAMMSSLYVEVRNGKDLVHRDTYALRLLPVDQWLDNDKSGPWLPSFVLPRDPAVERAVTAAQRYVRVIRDDPSAGFEGYQSSTSADAESLECVDLQVEAIWSALLHEWQLGYINPPPSYNIALDSQRLRMPSSIYEVRMGTCIDLALLFAACLELVDIHPVVFLLDGHALPGYWRHSDFREAYCEVSDALDPPEAGEEVRSTSPGAQRVSWRVGKPGYREVWKNIREGKLAPLETVRLTEHCGFREAREAGVEALKSAADFDSILDIVTAREHLVTPLPIAGERK